MINKNETGEPVAAEEGVQELTPITGKAAWEAKVKAKNPGRDYEASPDEVYNASMEGYDAEHEKVKSMMASNKSIGERMMQDPKAAAALAEFLHGAPLPASLRKYFDEEELSAKEGDEGYEEYLAAIKERTENAANNAKLQAEYTQNIQDSEARVEAFAARKGMTEEEVSDFLEKLSEIVVANLMKGIITDELMEIGYKGMNYDKDMVQNAEVNRIAGKNEKIIETRKVAKADALPSLGGASGVGSPAMDEPGETAKHFKKIGEASAENDIWKRGGYPSK